MSYIVNVSLNPSLIDLTQVHFEKESDGLDLRFVKSRNGYREEIFDLINPPLRLSIPFPDVVRFSHNSALIAKIEKLGIQIFKHTLSQSDDSGYYAIPVQDSQKFFESLLELQNRGTKFCISPGLLRDTLDSLKEMRSLTACEVEMFKSSIKTSWTLSAYEEETKRTADVQKALSLALYYRNSDASLKKNTSRDKEAMYWLCQAQSYLPRGQTLSTFINLEAFLQEISKIEIAEVFFDGYEEIADAIAKYASIKEICLNSSTFYNHCVDSIGKFLKKTTSVERVGLTHGSSSFDHRNLTRWNIYAIANALEKSACIREIDVSSSPELGDAGVLQIIVAIQNNPHSKIKSLILSQCNMTDTSALTIMRLLREKPQITKIITDSNPGISKPLQEEISRILQERNQFLNQ